MKKRKSEKRFIREAAYLMRQRGMSIEEIAIRLSINSRVVYRLIDEAHQQMDDKSEIDEQIRSIRREIDEELEKLWNNHEEENN